MLWFNINNIIINKKNIFICVKDIVDLKLFYFERFSEFLYTYIIMHKNKK